MKQEFPLGSDVALTPGDRQQLVDPFAPVRGQGMHWQDRSERYRRRRDWACPRHISDAHDNAAVPGRCHSRGQLTKAAEGSSHYGYRSYQYGYKKLDDDRNEIHMISHQPEG